MEFNNAVAAGFYKPTLTGKATVKFIEEIWPDIFQHEITLGNLGYHLGGARFEEILFIASIARHLDPRQVLEIGTCEGRTTINIARNCPSLVKLYTLNLPPDDDLNSRWLPQDRFIYEETKARIGANFRNTPYEEKIEQIYANSQDYSFARHAPIDLALIDAGTQSDYVINDSESCWKILRQGGVVIWRAYNYADGVTMGVDAFAQKRGIKVFNIYKTTLAVAFKEEGKK